MVSYIPSWLDALPQGAEPNPPVDTNAQGLPFGELTWENFERLVLRLVRRDAQIDDCVIYGTAGQEQHGLDILATLTDQVNTRVCYQCKRVTEFGPTKITDAVEKFLSGKWADSAREFVLCIAIPLSTTQQQDALDAQRKRLSEKGIKLTIWDGGAAGPLCERLKVEPELVDDFFSRSWVERFNGHAAADALGVRLNGYELGELRKRLLSLYSVIFIQHDPGLRGEETQKLEYRERYVMADVAERNKFDVLLDDRPAVTRFAAEDAPEERLPRARNANVASPTTATYETHKPVFDWLVDQQSCVILGEPGYGKSATLRYLALSILQPEVFEQETLKLRYSSSLPVWVSFARLSAAIERKHDTSIDDFFGSWLHQYSYDDIFPLYERAVQGGQVLLLVDGLDEAITELAGREALDRIVTFAQAAKALVVCTSRPRGYKALGVPAAWTTASLLPLSDQKIEELATNWFSFLERGTELASRSEGDDTSSAVSRAHAFLAAAKASSKTIELARNPLLCQALIQLFRYSHQLPEARVTAYQQIVELLLSKHPAARAQAGGTSLPAVQLDLKTSELTEILIRLAWSMQSYQPGNPLPKAQCEQVCAKFLEDDTFGLGQTPVKARRLAVDVIEQLINHYGVLVERAPNELGFLHLSIQEYLAAEYVARLHPREQLSWLSEFWIQPAWHESLISWFGILGARGDKVLAKQAAQLLEDMGNVGEWQRMQSLELRAEIATTDLDLPISEARRIIEQAAIEVEISPFIELRSALSRSIALGALSTSVKSECQTAIQRWLPGQSSSKRAQLLEAFRTWSPSEALRGTLLRAFQDHDGRCRRLAVEAFSDVYPEDAELVLKRFAIHHAQPEVRAAALHGLATNPAWTSVAAEAALANIGSRNADLLLAMLRIKIHQGEQTDDDQKQTLLLWQNDVLDYWVRDEPTELLHAGWPNDSGLRKAFVAHLKKQTSTSEIELPLLYLLRSYPGDDEVAGVVGGLFKRFGRHFALNPSRIWVALQAGFKGNSFLQPIVREMLDKDRERYARIHWGPDTVPAMILVGDQKARDDLVTAYEGADLRSRYWIATALYDGWGSDELVLRKLKEWASGKVCMAAPLARWADRLVVDVDERRQWLRMLAKETASTREIGAIVALLKTEPDDQTRLMTEELLENSKVWYYHRMTLKGLYARAFPETPKALEIFEQAFNEIDGPNPGSFASSFQSRSEYSRRLLAAAVPAQVDVRMTVASVLCERVVDYETAEKLTPDVLAEENSGVRAASLIARARAARMTPKARAPLIELLTRELSAVGSDMDLRSRTALAGLLELEAYEEIAVSLGREPGRKWTHRLIDRLDGDPLSIGVCVQHWARLQPFLAQHEVESELPVAEIVFAGYDSLLEQTSLGTQALDAYFQTPSRDFINSSYLESFARRQPKSPLLRSTLLHFFAPGRAGNLGCTAARLLARDFGSEQDIWLELSARFGAPVEGGPHMTTGVIGHLALGWPDGAVATWLRSASQEQLAQLTQRDRLLVAVLLKDAQAAERAAVEMIDEPFQSWRYRMEDTYALRVWAGTAVSADVLTQWLTSESPSFSLTALLLMQSAGRNFHASIDALRSRFNKELAGVGAAPTDGLNAAEGLHIAWALGAYASLKPAKTTSSF